MADSTSQDAVAPPRVAAIVPAFNEAETLADVLSVLKRSPVDEILVVSDGSTDDTVHIARSMGVRTIHLRQNHGKAMAMAMGVGHTSAPVLLFVDGDILNLSEYLITNLLQPVATGEAAMAVGIRHRGFLVNFFHARFGPLLSGIRAMRREVFETVPNRFLRGFAVETALNYVCNRLGLPIETVVLHGLQHLVKEKKRGFSLGVEGRFRMFGAVFAAWLSLHWERPLLEETRTARSRRVTPSGALQPGADYVSW